MTVEAASLVNAARAATASWQAARSAAERQTRSADMLARAYQLGEGSLNDLLAARRLANEAQLAAHQQQLDALATQTYAWQGQIWPGQQMQWEIEEQSGERRTDDESGARWQTRLRLQLPQLGGIEAHLTLRPGGEIGIALSAEQRPSEQRLESAAPRLREQLADAGLRLTQFTVKHDEAAE